MHEDRLGVQVDHDHVRRAVVVEVRDGEVRRRDAAGRRRAREAEGAAGVADEAREVGADEVQADHVHQRAARAAIAVQVGDRHRARATAPAEADRGGRGREAAGAVAEEDRDAAVVRDAAVAEAADREVGIAVAVHVTDVDAARRGERGQRGAQAEDAGRVVDHADLVVGERRARIGDRQLEIGVGVEVSGVDAHPGADGETGDGERGERAAAAVVAHHAHGAAGEEAALERDREVAIRAARELRDDDGGRLRLEGARSEAQHVVRGEGAEAVAGEDVHAVVALAGDDEVRSTVAGHVADRDVARIIADGVGRARRREHRDAEQHAAREQHFDLVVRAERLVGEADDEVLEAVAVEIRRSDAARAERQERGGGRNRVRAAEARDHRGRRAIDGARGARDLIGRGVEAGVGGPIGPVVAVPNVSAGAVVLGLHQAEDGAGVIESVAGDGAAAEVRPEGVAVDLVELVVAHDPRAGRGVSRVHIDRVVAVLIERRGMGEAVVLDQEINGRDRGVDPVDAGLAVDEGVTADHDRTTRVVRQDPGRGPRSADPPDARHRAAFDATAAARPLDAVLGDAGGLATAGDRAAQHVHRPAGADEEGLLRVVGVAGEEVDVRAATLHVAGDPALHSARRVVLYSVERAALDAATAVDVRHVARGERPRVDVHVVVAVELEVGHDQVRDPDRGEDRVDVLAGARDERTSERGARGHGRPAHDDAGGAAVEREGGGAANAGADRVARVDEQALDVEARSDVHRGAGADVVDALLDGGVGRAGRIAVVGIVTGRGIHEFALRRERREEAEHERRHQGRERKTHSRYSCREGRNGGKCERGGSDDARSASRRRTFGDGGRVSGGSTVGEAEANA
ncbi:MAG: hypothetical protein JNM84_14225 [Planctomycetes bacterium]|nr:hypothetical protein [Planctomycetota bacterium]